jgi:thiol-disulfide isomerase/thioredoxin
MSLAGPCRRLNNPALIEIELIPFLSYSIDERCRLPKSHSFMPRPIPKSGTAKIVLLGTAVAALIALVCSSGRLPPSSPANAASERRLVEVRSPLRTSKPSFSLDDLAGARHDLSGRPAPLVLVHFFATWCEPCREELPALQRLSDRVNDGSLAVFAISVGEPDVRVRRFFEPMPVTFPVLLDRDKEVAKTWQVETLPTTYVLDGALKPRLLVEGEFEWDQVKVGELLDAVSSRGE